MRILVISPSYPPAKTGEAEHGFQISARLAQAGHEVTVLSNRHDQPLAPAGFALQAVMPGWQWQHLPLLWRQLRRADPEAILLVYTAWLFDSHPMITFLSTLLGRLPRPVRLLTLYEISDGSAPGDLASRTGRKLLLSLIGRNQADYSHGTLLSGSHRILALGPSILATLAQRDPTVAARTVLVPPPPLLPAPADLSDSARRAARARLGLPDDAFVLAYFGFVYKGKGVDVLLQALKALQGSGQPSFLLMAGGGRDEGQAPPPFEAGMRALAASLGVADRVLWSAGYASGSASPGQDLLAADVAALPFDDGAELRRSSLAVMAAAELPIITTTPGPDETAFIDGVNVLLCPPRDTQALTAAASRLQQDPALRGRLRDGARQLAEDWFSWKATMRQLERALQP